MNRTLAKGLPKKSPNRALNMMPTYASFFADALAPASRVF